LQRMRRKAIRELNEQLARTVELVVVDQNIQRRLSLRRGANIVGCVWPLNRCVDTAHPKEASEFIGVVHILGFVERLHPAKSLDGCCVVELCTGQTIIASMSSKPDHLT